MWMFSNIGKEGKLIACTLIVMWVDIYVLKFLWKIKVKYSLTEKKKKVGYLHAYINKCKQTYFTIYSNKI